MWCMAGLDPVSASASARVAFTHKLGVGVEAVELEQLNQRAWERMYASMSNSVVPAAARARRGAAMGAFTAGPGGGECGVVHVGPWHGNANGVHSCVFS